jgi:CheY-like chemotaxis protein
MDREKLITFIHAAGADLASIRRSLLLLAQGERSIDLSILREALTGMRVAAFENMQPGLAVLIDECDKAVGRLSLSEASPVPVYSVLDLVAKLEAELLAIPLYSPEFLSDVNDLVETSFQPSGHEPEAEPPSNDFEIDAETFEIYRSEAADLLANIDQALKKFSETSDQSSLWEIRRNAHTLKGAAGIVGLDPASTLAHQMEDLLDKLVDTSSSASPEVIDFLERAAQQLEMISIASDRGSTGTNHELQGKYQAIVAQLSRVNDKETRPKAAIAAKAPVVVRDAGVESSKPASTPIVRVALERLDELIRLSHMLSLNRTSIAEHMSDVDTQTTDPRSLIQLFDTQYALIAELHSRLQRIRMVRFGTLETRLARTVHVTCLDTGKKAIVQIENGDAEIDTQIIDALIEPLLHLLKNAVVHGIESPETRRLIGKPEKGRIVVRIEADREALVLSVSDDGRGIAVNDVKEKAIQNGVLAKDTADSISERELMKLVFNRGLTTAETLDLNAGRGVGMSIVKEAVEARGGRVLIDSTPQKGTTFTILMPLFDPHPLTVTSTPTNRSADVPSPLILIVDDSATIRRQLQTVVENAGYRSITAENGADALELLLNGTVEPDIILSDVEMPQIDGWTFLEYIKTDDNLGRIPVVMITSLKASEHRDLAINLGASDLVEKPFSESDIVRVVEEYAGVAAAV